MAQVDSENSTPIPDKDITAAKKGEQDERGWQAGYAAGYAAKLAGKPTPRTPHGVDGLSYASGAIEGTAAGERELDPKDVLRDLFEQELVPDPAAMTDRVIRHLRDAGFEITPIDYPKRGEA